MEYLLLSFDMRESVVLTSALWTSILKSGLACSCQADSLQPPLSGYLH